MVGEAVSFQEGAVLKQSSTQVSEHDRCCDRIGSQAVLRVTSYLSCLEAAASCPVAAFPLELLGQEASPLEDPSEAACQGAGPSYLQWEESDTLHR